MAPLGLQWRNDRGDTNSAIFPVGDDPGRAAGAVLDDAGQLAASAGLPLHEWRQAHQISLGVGIGAEPESGPPVVDEVEFHVTTAFEQ